MGGFSCKYSILIWNLSYLELSSQGKKIKKLCFWEVWHEIGNEYRIGPVSCL